MKKRSDELADAGIRLLNKYNRSREAYIDLDERFTYLGSESIEFVDKYNMSKESYRELENSNSRLSHKHSNLKGACLSLQKQAIDTGHMNPNMLNNNGATQKQCVSIVCDKTKQLRAVNFNLENVNHVLIQKVQAYEYYMENVEYSHTTLGSVSTRLEDFLEINQQPSGPS